MNDDLAGRDGPVDALSDGEHARAEWTLPDSEQWHRTLFEVIDEGVCLFERLPPGPDGLRDYCYLAMNPAMRAMLGVSDLTGRSIRDTFPDEVEDWYDDYDRVLETGQPSRIERVCRRQGVVLEMFVAPLDDGSGQRLFAVIQNVTERRRIEAFVRADAERMAAVLEAQREIARAKVEYADLLQLVLDWMSRLTGGEGACFERLEGEDLVYEAATGLAQEFAGMRLKAAESLSGLSLTRGELMRADDIETDPRVDRAACRRIGLRSMLVMPLRYGDDLFGVLKLMSSRVAAFDAGTEDTLRLMGEFLGATIARQGAQEALRHSREALQQVNERFVMALGASPVVVFSQDLSLRYTWIENPALGYQPEECAGKTDYDLFERAEDADRLIAIKQRVLDTGEPAREEVSIESEGVQRWFDLNVQPQRKDGQILGVIGTAVDITERKHSELERLRLVSIVQGSRDFMGLSDPEGRPVFLNQGGRRLVGLDDDFDVTGTSIPEYFLPEDRDFIEQVVMPKVFAEGRWVGEVRLRHWKTQEAIPVVYDLFCVEDPATGEVVNLAAVIRDMTDWKHAEAALREINDRYALVLKGAGASLWDWDVLNHRVLFSPQWKRMRGYADDEIGDAEVEWSSGIHPDDAPRVMAAVKSHFAGETAVFAEEYRVRHKDGSWIWISDRGLALRDTDGRVVRMAGSEADITDRKLAEMALREAAQRKDEFLATLAHELRNPLAPLRTGLEILRLAEAGSRAGAQALGMMGRQLDQLIHLVDDLLDLSRITQGRILLRREQVLLADVLEHALETTRPLIEDRGHRLELDIPAEALGLDADPLRLAQVFANLLSNAAKYTEPGGRITLQVRCEDGEAVVAVTDDGIGISETLLPRVFEMFVQDHSHARGHSGLGIGLHLVQRLVMMHGGHVEARSAGLGQGSTFVVRLPLAAPRSVESDDAPGGEAGIGSPGAGRRILIIDDNQDAADSLGMMLTLVGHETRSAYDGLMGLGLGEDFRPELILLDLGMPGLDGYATAERIRRSSWGREVVLVALTGWGQDEDRHRTRAAGFDHHLVKPVDVEALTTLLAGLERIADL